MNELKDLKAPSPVTHPNKAQREGPVARAIEQQTAKLPFDLFLWAALGSVVISLAYQLSGKKKEGNFVAHWVPSILSLGIYNKLVKLHGSDGE